jgi:transaldolase/transaldolase/glucose-6-phosphate isomerase
MDKATKTIEKLNPAGIKLEEITQKLETEGIDKFIKPYDKMLQAIEKQKKLMQV